MKVFISQPMHGLSEDQIKHELEEAKKRIISFYPDKNTDIEFVSTYEQPHPDPEIEYKNIRLYYLGNSIKRLGECDAIYFCPGWYKANGCRIEHMIAELYNIEILNWKLYYGG